MRHGKPSDEQLGGRMHVGQQYIERVWNEIYINRKRTAGSEQSDSGKQVTPMLFARAKGVLGLGAQIIPNYPGDADFNIRSLENQNTQMQDTFGQKPLSVSIDLKKIHILI